MSFKTRRRKIGSQPSAKRVDRRRRAQAKFLQFCASQWFNRKSLLDQLRKCDQPVSGEPIRASQGKSSLRQKFDHAAADAALKRVEDFRAMYPGN